MTIRAWLCFNAILLFAAIVCVREADCAEPPPGAGEPYALASRKLVFTTWRFIRPGSFRWVNRAGQNVSVAGSEDAWGATLEKKDHPLGIRLVAQPAVKMGQVIRLDKSWEAHGVSLETVIQDGDIFRAWGVCADAGAKKYFCYFESKDGLHWERPEFDFVEYGGMRKNNLIDFAPGSVFKDPSAPPGERYKWVSLETISPEELEQFKRERPGDWDSKAIRNDVGHIYAICGAVSPDGLRWKRLPGPLVVEHSDTQIVAFYDEARKQYVIFTRNYAIGARAPGAKENPTWWGGDAPGIGRRSIGRTESKDFRRFPLSRVVLEPGPERLPDDVFYTNCKTTIPGACDFPLLFPAIWHTSSDTTSIDLAVSDDGVNWHFLPGSPVMGTAPYGEWDGGCVFTRPNLIELAGGDLTLFYTGYNFPHKYPRGQLRFGSGAAVWPKGRLVAVEAVGRGEFATAAILPPGRKIQLNALTSRAGHILVEIAGETGAPIPGREFARATAIVGDQPAAPLKWGENQDIGIDPNKPVILRFRMDQAKLFAIEFTD